MARTAKKVTVANQTENEEDKKKKVKKGVRQAIAKKVIGKKKEAVLSSPKKSSDTTSKVKKRTVRARPAKRKLTVSEAKTSSSRKRKGELKKRSTPKKKASRTKKESPEVVKGLTESEDEIEEQGAGDANRPFTIVTWNVAGLRALVKKDACRFITSDKADVVLLQETKCAEIPAGFPSKGFKAFIGENPGKTGYAGVILLSKQKPIKVQTTLEDVTEELGVQGRLIVAEYEKFYLINAYVPNSGRGLVNLAKRKVWDDFFIDYVKKLDAVKPVIYAGDLNVAHEEIDLANPKTNHNKTAGFTDQERGDFTRLLNAGFVDVFRSLHPDKAGAYTFWSTMHNARASNIGWRLDYFVVSERLMEKVVKCEINSRVLGSDHCPVTLQIDLPK
ncbi:unnamed protein product [Toxocara canis]|uniref:DNA-(apurinic or apyrimidinic site) endonuclease n=1 Tax=Toxocara canis TaxID=6265 RepID=A0A183UL70_TOXCA|nr:unnamed protein product [Toxocara canis]